MMTTKILFAPVLASALALSSLAHAQAGTTPTPPADAAAAPAATASPTKTVTDPEIVGILETANDGEIDQAKTAKKITKSKPVRDFADLMILEHKQVNKDLKDFTKKVKMKPAETDTQKDLKKMSAASIKKFKAVSGKEFDRIYVADQVTMHQGLLDQLDSTLIPNVQDPTLKDLLNKIRTSVAAHLEKAKTLQNTIGTSG